MEKALFEDTWDRHLHDAPRAADSKYLLNGDLSCAFVSSTHEMDKAEHPRILDTAALGMESTTVRLLCRVELGASLG